MNLYKLKDLWKKDEQKSFEGWDFSYLHNRFEEEELPWNYKAILKKYLKHDYQLLDMGTGGGEFLLSLNHPYEKTSITEAWEPNVKLCEKKLAPLGICVRQVNEDSRLPFKDDAFDMIINRHESYDIKEIKRILKSDGIFITQQVGGRNNEFLSKKLINDFVPQYPYLKLNYAIEELKENSFEALYKNEFFPYLRFYDVGAIVYFAKVIEWEFPGFSVDNCFDKLCKIHEELKEKPYIESYEHRYIVVAKNLKK